MFGVIRSKFFINTNMRIYEIVNEAVGRVVKNVNTTADVQPGEIQRQAKKLGLYVDDENRPPIASTSGEETKNHETRNTNKRGKRTNKNNKNR